MTINELPAWVVQKSLLPLPKGDILHAQAVCRSWHTLAHEANFLKKWLNVNGIQFTGDEQKIRQFFAKQIYTNMEELLPVLRKVFAHLDLSKEGSTFQVGVFFHSLHFNHSIQFIAHPPTRPPLFKCLTDHHPHYFLILPVKKTTECSRHVTITSRKTKKHTFIVYTPPNVDDEKKIAPILNLIKEAVEKDNDSP